MEQINQLKREGLSILAISNLTGYDRKTIRKYLLAPAARPEYPPRPKPAGKLDPFKEYLGERLQAGVWNARVLLRELRSRNYTGSYTILTDWLRPKREAAYAVAVRRFETPPGKQAQVDWGHLGSLRSEGGEQQMWGFTITLGYSRRMTAEAATDQKLGTLLRMHEAAFQELGGVPEEILYDRMKTIWTGTDDRGEIIWNAVFLDFARYWGFQPRLCRPYRAQTKGKIESGVKYVRRNFLCGLLGREPGILIWSPDSLHLLFSSGSDLTGSDLTWIRGDGAGEPHTILKGGRPYPYSFTPDGRRLAYIRRSLETGLDLWTVALDLTDPDHPRAGKPEEFLRTATDESVPQFSPDGRWIAYRSIETGGPEIYVRPFPPAGGGKWQISTGGGIYAVWSKNGRELFYETPDSRIMVVDYSADGASFLPGQPRLWSDKQLFFTGNSNLDLAPDGKRFVVLSLPEAAPGAKGSVHVTVLENFFDWVRKRLP